VQVNKRLNPVLLTASYPTESFFAPIFAYAFLGQSISAADGIGGCIIALGLAMTVYAKWKEGANAAPQTLHSQSVSESTVLTSGSLHGISASRVFVDPSTVEDPAILTLDAGGAGSPPVSLPIVFAHHNRSRSLVPTSATKLLGPEASARFTRSQEIDAEAAQLNGFQGNSDESDLSSRMDMLTHSLQRSSSDARSRDSMHRETSAPLLDREEFSSDEEG
jgi:hypothetical protein